MAKTTPEQRVRDLYGFAFPDDFFEFREFLTRLAPNLLGDACDMHPAFPFDVAAGRSATDYLERPLWQDRYYHDLPEFVTVFTGTTDGLHWGYFFDAPGELPPVIAHYWHSDTFEHASDGDTIFEAVRWNVEQSVCDYLEMDDPRDRDLVRLRLEQLAAVREQLSAFWGADRPETADEYLDAYDGGREYDAETFDRLGIIVPEGKYRPLSVDYAVPQRTLDPQRPDVERLTAEAMQLLRDGSPGAALKLGRDLWIMANEFPECYDLLDAAYPALGREPLRRLMNEARDFRAHCDKPRGSR